MHSIDTYRQLIEHEIAALKIKAEPRNLYDPIKYLLGLGGKRMRPILSMLSAELFGAKPEMALNAGLSIELFHNFSLIHDDIMDNAPLRRGFPTVHEKWSEKTGILSGDALFVVAYHYLARNESHHLTALLHTFSVRVMEVCEGQQMDMDFEERDDVTIDEYIEMIRLKTSVLLGASLEMGAIIANANEQDIKRIYDFGEHVGIAFQLQDDILDLYADPDKFGKQIGGDIIANKKTFLLLKAYELSNCEQHARLKQLENESDFIKKVNETRIIFDDLGIRDLARAEMNKHYDFAKQSIAAITVPKEKIKPLLGIADYLMNREV